MGYRDGIDVVRHTVKTARNSAAIRVTCFRQQLMADGQDIGQIEAEIIDVEGNLCPSGGIRTDFYY